MKPQVLEGQGHSVFRTRLTNAHIIQLLWFVSSLQVATGTLPLEICTHELRSRWTSAFKDLVSSTAVSILSVVAIAAMGSRITPPTLGEDTVG